MSIYRGCVIFSEINDINFGKKKKGEYERTIKFESQGWPKYKLRRNDTSASSMNIISPKTTFNINNPPANAYNMGISPTSKNISGIYTESGGKRPVTEKVEKIHQIIEDYKIKGYEVNSTLEEQKTQLNKKKRTFLTLKAEEMSLSKNFKGQVSTWNSISNFSESAFHCRRQGEALSQKTTQVDEEMKKLNSKKEYLSNLIQQEENRMKQVKKEFADAHYELRSLNNFINKQTKDLKFRKSITMSMKARLGRAEMYEKDLDVKSDTKFVAVNRVKS